MQNNHNLIVQYLQIMQEQENMINELSKSNVQLVKRNKELLAHKRLYKENTLYWKAKHDTLQQCLIDIKVRCTNVYEQNAINIYKENQKRDR